MEEDDTMKQRKAWLIGSGVIAMILALGGYTVWRGNRPLSVEEVVSRINGTWVSRKGRMAVEFAFDGSKGTVTMYTGQGPETASSRVESTSIRNGRDEATVAVYPGDPVRLNRIRIMLDEHGTSNSTSTTIGLGFHYSSSRAYTTIFTRVQ